jgi:hypothetical protein
MSFLGDIFGGDINNATNDQVQGLVQGANAAEGPLNNNPGIITSLGGQALQPFQQNQATAQQGIGALGNLLGLNGAAGTQSALTNLQTTPGYQFQLGQGDNAINAAAAAGGTLNSGNQATALSNYNQGLAGNTYQSAVSNLAPFLGLSENSASGAAGVLGGETSALTGNNNTLAQLLQGTFAGAGNAQASGQLAQAASGQSLLGGLLGGASSLFGAAGGLSGIGGGLSNLFGSGGGAGGLINDASLGSSIGGFDLGF